MARRVDPSSHPSAKDADRLEIFQSKVAKAEREAELALLKRNAVVDVAAANRFISHAIPDLNEEQRRRLKEAGEREQKRHEEAGAASKKRRRGGGADEAQQLLDELLGAPSAAAAAASSGHKP